MTFLLLFCGPSTHLIWGAYSLPILPRRESFAASGVGAQSHRGEVGDYRGVGWGGPTVATKGVHPEKRDSHATSKTTGEGGVSIWSGSKENRTLQVRRGTHFLRYELTGRLQVYRFFTGSPVDQLFGVFSTRSK